MRSWLVALAIASLTVGLVPASANHSPPDGVTARIRVGNADSVVQADLEGNYQVQVQIYQKVNGTWSQVALQATLRMFVFNATSQVDEDKVSIPFTSKATSVVTVRVPRSSIPAPNFADVFVTFSELGGDPVPTSHHNAVKNQLIGLGQFDAADELDFHGAQRPLFL